jgi:hypothetical protein
MTVARHEKASPMGQSVIAEITLMMGFQPNSAILFFARGFNGACDTVYAVTHCATFPVAL